MASCSQTQAGQDSYSHTYDFASDGAIAIDDLLHFCNNWMWSNNITDSFETGDAYMEVRNRDYFFTPAFIFFGMAIGGWIAGLFYDLTGSYQAAFANAVVFNILNTAIAAILYRRSRRISPAAALAATDTIQPRH